MYNETIQYGWYIFSILNNINYYILCWVFMSLRKYCQFFIFGVEIENPIPTGK